jgi:hypothetical protein
MRTLSRLCLICLAVVGSAAADAQTRSTGTSLQIPFVRNSPAAAPVVAARRLGLSRAPSLGARLKSESQTGLPHGLIGASIGAIVGGAIGYARVQMYCDGAARCNATPSTLTGAAIGAGVGALLEYFVRNGHK